MIALVVSDGSVDGEVRRYSSVQSLKAMSDHGNSDSEILGMLLRVGHAILRTITDLGLDVESKRWGGRDKI